MSRSEGSPEVGVGGDHASTILGGVREAEIPDVNGVVTHAREAPRDLGRQGVIDRESHETVRRTSSRSLRASAA